MSDKAIILNNEVMNRGADGFFQLEKDHEAVKEFAKDVKKKMVKFEGQEERFKWLVDNDYYYNVLEEYSWDDIQSVIDLAYSIEFSFKSYMAISKFYKDYALKTNDKKKYLEYYQDRCVIVALYLAEGDVEWAKKLVTSFMEQRVQPATPTFLNAGRSRRGEMVSCFLLEMDDSLNSINFNIATSMQLSKIGGGVALNVSKLRGRGESIKGVEGAAKGVMPVLKLLEDAFSYADQMGQRKGSGAAYYNVFGWDVIEFLDTKKINADEKSRIQTLSIGLIVNRKFFELVAEDKDFYMFAPYTVYKEYGQHLDDMDIDAMYDELVANPNVKKKSMRAQDMLTKIAQTQMESGYPYFMFKTNANEQHPLKNIGQVKMSNLCTEIFQLQETSTINDYGQEDVIRRDINCNLASLNIVNVMEKKGSIEDSVYTGVYGLTKVSDMTEVENSPTTKKANDELHAVGLGAMNLHGYLAKNKISYESEEAKDFANTFFMTMNYYSIKASMEIAKQKRETFKDFDKSDYATGEYFKDYIVTDHSPKTKKVKELFEGHYIPTPEDWKVLKDDVRIYGLYHAYRLAIAPTQSISYVQNATSSVMPVVEHIETRTYGNATTYYPMPYLSQENYFFYKSAYNIDQFKLIDLIATIQPHIDQGISTILHVNSNITTRQLGIFYAYASHKGLKSLYYTRTKRLGIEECTSCAV